MVEAYIARVKEVNPVINAVVQHRFEQAIQEAKEIDLNIRNTSKSEEELSRDTPLLGVPITIKESIPVKGEDKQQQYCKTTHKMYRRPFNVGNLVANLKFT